MLSKNPTLSEYSKFVNSVYGLQNDRCYTVWDMLANTNKFAMRSIKGVRKNNREKIRLNMLITMSWFTSLMNQFHVDLDGIVWERFPYLCSYCGECPCACKAEKVSSRRKVLGNMSMKPVTMADYQKMFNKIYPKEGRTEKDAAIHLAEEAGELSEAFHIYMGDRKVAHFNEVRLEAADFFSCMMGVMNSSNIDCQKELVKLFSKGCFVCGKAQCICTFDDVNDFKS